MAGGMRRPPRLWEQKLEQMVRGVSRGAAAASTGNADQGLPPGPGGANDQAGEDTPVVDPDPSTPRLPAAPSVFAAIGGLSVIWTGLDADGDPFPAGTTVQVHVSTSTGFTPDGTTLRGVIGSTERLEVTGLTSGTTYYVVFVTVAPDGTVGEPSAQQSATAGFVLKTNIGEGEITADLVSFDASAIGGIQQFVGTATPTTTAAEGSTWINTSNGSYYTLTSGAWVQRQWGQAAISAGAINTLQIATGAITADSAIIANGAIGNAQIANLSASKLTAGTINASVITVSNLNADNITAGTLSGRVVRTSSGGNRVQLSDSGANFGDSIAFYNGNVRVGSIYGASTIVGNYVYCDGNFIAQNGLSAFSFMTAPTITATTALASDGTLAVGGASTFSAQANFDGQVVSANIDNNPQAGNPEVGINTTSDRLRRIGSSQNIKYDITTLSGELSESVDDERQADVVTVDPDNLLNVAVVEFSAIDDGEPSTRRLVGFIAEDMAGKYPLGATRDANGTPIGIETQGVLASLVAIVQRQQQTIDNLTARLDALEAN